MNELKLVGEMRTEFGKGAARRIRRADQIPAVIYGHGAPPLHITLPEKATGLAVRGSNALLRVVVDGTEHLALVKDMQRDVVRQNIEHIDLLTVTKGEKVHVDVSVHITGEVSPGAVMNQEEPTVLVEADATNLPSHIEVDVEGRDINEHVYARDLVLPAGTALVSEADLLIVHIAAPIVQDLGEEPAEDAAATVGGAAAPAAAE